jgi:hypothetical protein
VPTDRNLWTLRPVNSDRRIPPNPCSVAAFNVFITGEVRFVFRGNSVQVVGGGDHRHAQVAFLGPLEQAQHDFPAALRAVSVNDLV